MTKVVKVLIAASVGLLFAAFAYSQNLNAQNQNLEEEVMQLIEKVASLEQRISVIEEATNPRMIPVNR